MRMGEVCLLGWVGSETSGLRICIGAFYMKRALFLQFSFFIPRPTRITVGMRVYDIYRIGQWWMDLP